MKPAIAFLAFLLGACRALDSAPPVECLAIEHVDVIPMDRERVLPDQTVLVRGDRIAELGANVSIPRHARRIDGRGKWLIPGLADMHTHFLSDDRIAAEFLPDELAVIVANGVTTLRNPIGKPEHLLMRGHIERGEWLGPALWIASPQLAGRKFGSSFLGRAVTTAEEARAAVRDFQREGYDFIKLTLFLTPPVYEAIVDEARQAGIRVIGHIGPQIPLARAIEAGQQIEHLDQFLEALVPPGAPFEGSVSDIAVYSPKQWESLDWLDATKIPALARACAEAGVWNTPTSTFIHTTFGAWRGDEELSATPDWRFLSASVRADLLRGRDHFWKNPPSAERRARYDELRNLITKALHDAGAKLLCGSDSPDALLLYGFSTHRELATLAGAGLSNYAALETATRNPHEWFGDLSEVGTISPGKRADLVLLGANPLADIAHTRAIEAVCVRGRWLDRGELDGLLEGARGRLSAAEMSAVP